MRKVLFTIGRYLGYGLFFVAALAFFVYLTLPLDALQNYLVRKASDEYDADLQIGELSTWRLTGVHARDVTLTPRPSPEQVEEMRQAREALKAWKEARAARAEEAKAAEPEAAKPKGKAKRSRGAADKGDEPAAEVEVAPPVVGADAPLQPGGAPSPLGKGAKGAKDTRGATDEGADEPPKVPRGPAPLHISELRARVGLFALLRGDLEAKLESSLLGGTFSAEVAQDQDTLALTAEWSDLDLAELSVLEAFLPLPLIGRVGGAVQLDVPIDETSKLRLLGTRGHVDLSISQAVIGPGQIESKKLGAFPYFDVPQVRVDKLGGRLAFDKQRATFEDFNFSGKDIEGEVTGYLALHNELPRWGPRAHLRFKFSDEFLKTHSSVRTALTSIPYLKQGQLAGFTGFAITGSVKSPQFRPRKESPYVDKSALAARARTPSTAADGKAAGAAGETPAAKPDRAAQAAAARQRFEERKKEMERARETGTDLPIDTSGIKEIDPGMPPSVRAERFPPRPSVPTLRPSKLRPEDIGDHDTTSPEVPDEAPIADEPLLDEPIGDEPIGDEPIGDEPTDEAGEKVDEETDGVDGGDDDLE